jgi:hypothetical protein
MLIYKDKNFKVEKIINEIEQMNLPQYGKCCVANIIAQLISGVLEINEFNDCELSDTTIPEDQVKRWSILKMWKNPAARSIYQNYIFRSSDDAECSKNAAYYSDEVKETWLQCAIELYKSFKLKNMEGLQ